MSGDGSGVYTPPSRRGGGNGGDGEVVVQQVKEEGVVLRYPTLAEDNYGAWAVMLKIFMRAQGLWAAVEGRQAVDDRLDQMAPAAIVQAVPESVMMDVAEQETAKKVWDALKEMHVGEERVKKARVQTLKRELDGMYMDESEKINEFCSKVTTIVNEIRSLGTKVEEIAIVEKLLRSVLNKFLPIVSTIEQWGDLTVMSVAEVIGRLRTFEESSKGRRRDREEGKLLIAHAEQRLTRAEWEAIVAEEKRNGKASGSGDNKSGDKKKYRGKFNKSKIDCCKCGEYGPASLHRCFRQMRSVPCPPPWRPQTTALPGPCSGVDLLPPCRQT
jgi:hypothetical protein